MAWIYAGTRLRCRPLAQENVEVEAAVAAAAVEVAAAADMVAVEDMVAAVAVRATTRHPALKTCSRLLLTPIPRVSPCSIFTPHRPTAQSYEQGTHSTNHLFLCCHAVLAPVIYIIYPQ